MTGRQHEFDFDAIGNRKWAGLTGNAADRRTYTANALNQYTSRQNPLAPFSGTQAFIYDEDGNLLDDGQWLYRWDAENRLISLETKPTLIGTGISPAAARRLEFTYDYLGRRVEKLVRAGWNGSTYATVLGQRRFLYDGWSLVAEYAVSYFPLTLTLVRSYTWGLDIARSLTDAGGVGALLQIADHATGKTYLPAYDGNGNIAALINSASGATAATYEYSPFGETLTATVHDTTVSDQPFRFSTKFTDSETGLVYYGRRYYDAGKGRFVGRDPIEEQGGLNLYGFCGNNGVNRWDYLGMEGQFMIWTGSGPDGTPVLQDGGFSMGDTTTMSDQQLAGLWSLYAGALMANAAANANAAALAGNFVIGQDSSGNYLVASSSTDARNALLDFASQWEQSTGNTAFVGSGSLSSSGLSVQYFGTNAGPITVVAPNSAAPTSDPGKILSVGYGASGTIFLGAYGATAGVSATANSDLSSTVGFSISPLFGGGAAVYVSTGPVIGVGGAQPSGYSSSTYSHGEGGLGLGAVASVAADWDKNSVQLSPPTSTKIFSPKGGAGGAAYVATGQTYNFQFTIPAPPVPKTPVNYLDLSGAMLPRPPIK